MKGMFYKSIAIKGGGEKKMNQERATIGGIKNPCNYSTSY